MSTTTASQIDSDFDTLTYDKGICEKAWHSHTHTYTYIHIYLHI